MARNTFDDIVLRLVDSQGIEQLGGASDCGMLIYHRGVLIAWTDDYGTARHPDHELLPELGEAIEQLVEPASDVWALLGTLEEPMHGKPRLPHWSIVVLWVIDDLPTSTPNAVACWSMHEHENNGTELEEIAKRRWYDQAGESYAGEWRFWTTIEHLNIPAAPVEKASA
jgi:hypothetical protein